MADIGRGRRSWLSRLVATRVKVRGFESVGNFFMRHVHQQCVFGVTLLGHMWALFDVMFLGLYVSKKKWTFSFARLFEPIPPLQQDKRLTHGPSRTKFNGHQYVGVPNFFQKDVC